MDDFVFIQFGGIDVDVNDGRFLGKFRNFACDAVIKADAEGKKQIDAMVCWLAETPLDRARKYLVRHTTRETKAAVASIAYRIDVKTSEELPATELRMNDIARVTFKLAQPVFSDAYRVNRATGAFIVIDESTNNTVGAGMIL